MKLGERTDAIGTEKLILVQHLRENPAQPFLIDEREDAAISHTRSGLDRSDEWTSEVPASGGYAAETWPRAWGTRFALPRFNHGRGAERQETHHGPDLQLGGAAIG